MEERLPLTLHTCLFWCLFTSACSFMSYFVLSPPALKCWFRGQFAHVLWRHWVICHSITVVCPAVQILGNKNVWPWGAIPRWSFPLMKATNWNLSFLFIATIISGVRRISVTYRYVQPCLHNCFRKWRGKDVGKSKRVREKETKITRVGR